MREITFEHQRKQLFKNMTEQLAKTKTDFEEVNRWSFAALVLRIAAKLETKLFIELLSNIYKDLGFDTFEIKLSTRPENRVGSDETWDQAEKALEDAIKKLGYE